MANKQYVLGRGELYFDAMLPNTKTKTGERFIGNAPAFTVTIESESLDHFDSTKGVREKDDSVLLQINRTGSITTDNIATENLALFILGSSATRTVAGASVVAEPINDVVKDRFYQLGTSSTNAAGVRNVSAVAVKKGATTLVAGTDYTLDATLGRIYIMPTSVTVIAGDDLTVDYTVGAYTIEEIKSGATATIDGALRFIAKNPKGPVRDVYIPYCRLSPSGELAMIGEEWQSMSFDLEIQKLNDTTEAIFFNGRAVV